ncbi:MAG: hypothetical protein ACR2NN_25015 [Bryobacteraceae bacterium]
MIDTIQDLEILSEQECSELRDLLFRLRTSWLKRNPALPFFTLGAASYLDAVSGREGYCDKALRFNPILRENMDWLYRRVQGALEPVLGSPVRYAENLALPGFHIYLSSKVFEKPIASIHCDSQYNLHEWNYPDADLTQPISFTLSIALPKNGGGLNVWDVNYQDIAGLTPPEIAGLMSSRKPVYHSYRVGHLVLHSGHVVHQAAPGVDVQPEDERITLQGHGLYANGAWQLYW